jgi:nucleoside-diphosphate-sugar epimerase
MHVFVTGATGFIGSATVSELIGAGHRVTGLARSDEGAAALADAGAEVWRGSLEDLDGLRRGAAAADAVIHTAFNHDFSVSRDIAAEADRRAIEALGAGLEGRDAPLVITSGTALAGPGKVATERDSYHPSGPAGGRGESEALALSMASRGIRPSVVRFPPTVHGERDHGFVAVLVAIAREKGVSGYVGDGSNRWAAVHRLDAANLFRLVVEAAPVGGVFHGVADEGVPTREIAELIGRHLDLPVESVPADHFGWLGAFFSLDVPASSALTQEQLGWTPVHPGLVEDLEAGHYFAPARSAA